MKITQSIETIKARCKGLFSICYAALDIMANEKMLNERAIRLLSKLKNDAEAFKLDSSEIRIIEKLLEKPETGWINRGMWKLEELGVLLWVLKLNNSVPPIWEQFGEDTLKVMTGIDNKVVMRSDNELEQYKEYLKTVNWRFYLEFFQRMGRTGDKKMNEEIVSKKVNELKADGIIDEVIEGDIGFDGVSFSKLNYFKKDSIRNIAEKRQQVFEWLEETDGEEDWD